jgi:hypothetical protein
MRLPHQQQEENERRINSWVPGAPQPALCLSKEPAVAIRAATTDMSSQPERTIRVIPTAAPNPAVVAEWRDPRILLLPVLACHSGAAHRVVILAQPESLYFAVA